jgi:ketosteroid isomerase-like protein
MTALPPSTQAADGDLAVADLIRRSEKANAALMRGDMDTYLDLITVSDDFTLMSPFGGQPSRGPFTRERWDRIGKGFKNGTLNQELVQAYGSADMVVLAVIERGHGEVGGLPTQEWPLRVTLVYRREGSEWMLVHRHADPLVKGILLEQAAWLARGEKER